MLEEEKALGLARVERRKRLRKYREESSREQKRNKRSLHSWLHEDSTPVVSKFTKDYSILDFIVRNTSVKPGKSVEEPKCDVSQVLQPRQGKVQSRQQDIRNFFSRRLDCQAGTPDTGVSQSGECP